jgi:serpin B
MDGRSRAPAWRGILRYTTLLLAALMTGALVTPACTGDPSGPGTAPITELPRALTVAERDVIDASNTFAFGLLREVRALEADSPNTFLSPLSASMALGMALNGAHGDTWTQTRDALGFAGLPEDSINAAYGSLIDLLLGLDPAVEIGLGNSIWADDVSLLPDFVDRMETAFDARIRSLDLQAPGAKDVMNAWVDSVTHGRIDTLIEQIPSNAVMYLINAIYFLADWRQPFDPDRTTAARFTRSDGSEVTVEMMADEVGHRTLNAGDPTRVQGVELPYAGGAFTAVAMLPPDTQSIDAFVAGLDEAAWDGWMQHFDEVAEAGAPDTEGLLVRMPKFELEWGAGLIPPLEALGMTDAFHPYDADFRRLAEGGESLYIFEVSQKTFVKVDERGTEAAAATSVGIGETSVPPSITLDRPFLFAIRERLSGTILFMGVIGDPSA